MPERLFETEVPRIGIIVVNLDSYSDTARCLESLATTSYPNTMIFVVDNGSKDGSDAQLRRDFHSVTHYRLPTNLGSTGGRNFGIRSAIQNSCDHVLLLDDDAIVTPGFLEPLVSRIESDPNIAAVTGKIYHAPHNPGDPSNVLWYAGCIRRWHAWYNHVGMGERDAGNYDTPTPVACMAACLMLMRSSAIQKIGGLSDDYFVYWEEPDWCARASKAGYQCYYEPKSIIYHNYKSGQVGKETPFHNYLVFRNALIFNKKHNPFWRRVQFWIAFPLLAAYRLAMDIRAKNNAGARAILWGIRDYFLGYRGPQGLREHALIDL